MQSLLLFPADVAVKRVRIQAASSMPLFPVEALAVRRAALRRRRDFAAGRFCARLALAELGRESCGIPIGKHGMPIWPEGFVGSITHDSDEACAAVASGALYCSIGMDLTMLGSVTGDLAPLVCADNELERSSDLPCTVDHLSLLFSAKESIYKCAFPIVQKFIDFADVVVEWISHDDDCHGTYRAAFVQGQNVWDGSRPIVGRWAIDKGRIYTSAYYR
ncbi:4'-phosphopantetheinyl transferase superfamily protein [Sphingomonas sp. 1185]|uniref:4'-phosphopantetheinyl transferase family protein n=1 Tax=Sphingomonas sp. 1185 TaxID=3156411 RepID=UPI0033970357